MSFFSSLAVNFGRVATFIQVLFYLPLALDIAGQDAFLALSASLASYYLFLSTVRLLTHKTRLAWIGQTLAVFQFVVIPACLLVCCNVYSPPSATIFPARRPEVQDKSASEVITSLFTRNGKPITSASSVQEAAESLTGSDQLDRIVSASVSLFFWLARRVPGWWHTLLRLSSPFFSLLEGVASLLVIQSLASTSRWIIASSLAAPSPRYAAANGSNVAATRSSATARWIGNTFLMRTLASIGFGASEVWQIFFLLVSATIYVTASFALYVSFDGATKDRPGTAAAIATSVTSTVWLTAIAFAIRKGNVIETSLMFAYVVFNIYQLGPSLSFTPDPISLIRSFKVNTHGRSFVESLPSSLQAPLPSKILQAVGSLVEVIAHWLGQSLDFLNAAGAALPKSVIVSLVYRLMVLYAASRILPMLKGSVARKSIREDVHRRRASWGRARSDSHIRDGADQEEEGSDWSSSSETGSSIGSSSGSEVEELEEEVWDDEEGRWILQRRRIVRRRRKRTPFDDDLDTEEVDDDDDDESYSEDDSGIAYDDGEKAKKQDLIQEGPELSLADTLKSPPPPSPKELPPTNPASMHRRRRRGVNRRSARNHAQHSATAAAALASGIDQETTRSGLKKRPNMSRPPSTRSHKRARPPPPSRRASSLSSASVGKGLGGGEGEGGGEHETFGSFISILVSYSRLVLIAVYSHLLLLDQKNQIYWRFLTVGLTLFLWGLELVISKEEDVVGGVGDLGTAGPSSMLAR
ncbi:hypothetical protein BCV70DRAFT_197223 [Testicularia cyperi]|uniref:ICE2-domain-containing protein n=1 Tax=Testicularia cyperi TaxID=1882483 RepID=A0A317XYX5_9BASI|nr:hypothetical protein BCV70DRAFT_197223 [Testicularia cyperi]